MTVTGASDDVLLAQARKGDAQAFAKLWERHRSVAIAAARQYDSNVEAEDIAAEAFANVLSALRKGSGPEYAFRAYLLRTVRSVAILSGKRRREQLVDDDFKLDSEVEPDDPMVTAFEHETAIQAFDSLPQRYQEVLWHTELDDKRPAQIADRLGLRPNSVSALAYRAREALRREYLTLHIARARRKAERGDDPVACRRTLTNLVEYVRGALSQAEEKHVREHLRGCTPCAELAWELIDTGLATDRMVRGVVLIPFLCTAAVGHKLLLRSHTVGKHATTQSAGMSVASGAAGLVAAGLVTAVVVSGHDAPSRPAQSPARAVTNQSPATSPPLSLPTSSSGVRPTSPAAASPTAGPAATFAPSPTPPAPATMAPQATTAAPATTTAPPTTTSPAPPSVSWTPSASPTPQPTPTTTATPTPSASTSTTPSVDPTPTATTEPPAPSPSTPIPTMSCWPVSADLYVCS